MWLVYRVTVRRWGHQWTLWEVAHDSHSRAGDGLARTLPPHQRSSTAWQRWYACSFSSVTIADVPVGGLDHLALTVTDLLADLLLGVDLGGVLCHHGGEEFVVGHLGFVHAVILQGQTVICGGVVDGLGSVTAWTTHDPTTMLTIAKHMIAIVFWKSLSIIVIQQFGIGFVNLGD